MDAQEFKRLRLELDYTQKQLGNKLGITDRQIRNYESGRTQIGITYVRLLKVIHGKELTWRRNRKSPKNPRIR